jgi:hypothetical protein
MADDKTAKFILALGLNDTEHKLRAQQIVTKLAETKLGLNQISGNKSGLALNQIVDGEADKQWLSHVEKIVRKERATPVLTGESKLPGMIPAKAKMTASKLFKGHYNKELVDLVKKLRADRASRQKMIGGKK